MENTKPMLVIGEFPLAFEAWILKSGIFFDEYGEMMVIETEVGKRVCGELKSWIFENHKEGYGQDRIALVWVGTHRHIYTEGDEKWTCREYRRIEDQIHRLISLSPKNC